MAGLGFVSRQSSLVALVSLCRFHFSLDAVGEGVTDDGTQHLLTRQVRANDHFSGLCLAVR